MRSAITVSAREARGRTACEAGAAVVEFALVLPIFIMLLFGVMTAGWAYADHLAITNAVREAGRLGAAIPYTTTPATAWADSVQQRVQQVYLNAGYSITSDQICVQLRDSSGASVAAPTSQGAQCVAEEPAPPTTLQTGSCVVKVWVSKPAEITLMVVPTMDFTIGARSVSQYGRRLGACTA